MTTKKPVTSSDEVRSALRGEVVNRPQFFDMKVFLPKQGRTDTPLAATDRLWIVLKTYAAGGENEMHAHPNEDHAFVVLQGSATFHGPNGETKVVGPNEGVMMPRGTFYSFRSIGPEPLVILRAGGVVNADKDPIGRIGADGKEMDAFSSENKEMPVILSDRMFG
jgi:mannose-6-phosphate isomerase-like protein (cupin superfamily)